MYIDYDINKLQIINYVYNIFKHYKKYPKIGE